MTDKDVAGSKLEDQISTHMNEIAILKRRNKELNTVYEETRVKLRKTEETQAMAIIGKEEAIISMKHAHEMSQTWQ